MIEVEELDAIPTKQQWLSLSEAASEVVAFKHYYGPDSTHFKLACHAALPFTLTPELVNLIRINFLPGTDTDWMAEVDLLLSDLCTCVNYVAGIYEMEPRVRELLLFELERNFGWERPKRVAEFLLAINQRITYPNDTVRQTHRFLAQAVLSPDTVLTEVKRYLNSILNRERTNLPLSPVRIIRLAELSSESLGMADDFAGYEQYSNDLHLITAVLDSREEALSIKDLRKEDFSSVVYGWWEVLAAAPPAFQSKASFSNFFSGNPFEQGCERFESDRWLRHLFQIGMKSRLFIRPSGTTTNDLIKASKSGRPIIIKGRSGSGRTTLLNWLWREIEPTSGLSFLFSSQETGRNLAEWQKTGQTHSLSWLSYLLQAKGSSELTAWLEEQGASPPGGNDNAEWLTWCIKLGQGLRAIAAHAAPNPDLRIFIDSPDGSQPVISHLVQQADSLRRESLQFQIELILTVDEGVDIPSSAYVVRLEKWWAKNQLKRVVQARLREASEHGVKIQTKLPDVQPMDEIVERYGGDGKISPLMTELATLFSVTARQPKYYEVDEKQEIIVQANRAQEEGNFNLAIEILEGAPAKLVTPEVNRLLAQLRQKKSQLNDEIKQSLEQAEEKRKAGRFDEAIAQYQAVLERDSLNTKAESGIMLARQQQERWEEIGDLIRQANKAYDGHRWSDGERLYEEARLKDASLNLFVSQLARLQVRVEEGKRAAYEFVSTEQMIFAKAQWPDEVETLLEKHLQATEFSPEGEEGVEERAQTYLQVHYNYLLAEIDKVQNIALQSDIGQLAALLRPIAQHWGTVLDGSQPCKRLETYGGRLPIFKEVKRLAEHAVTLFPAYETAAELAPDLDVAISRAQVALESGVDYEGAIQSAGLYLQQANPDSYEYEILQPRYETLQELHQDLTTAWQVSISSNAETYLDQAEAALVYANIEEATQVLATLTEAIDTNALLPAVKNRYQDLVRRLEEASA